MRGNDIFRLFLVIAITGVAYVINIYAVGIEKIKKKWPIYKCNPMIMPFAGLFGHDPLDNFTDCIAEIQKMQMVNFLNPINLIMSIMDATIKSTLGSINNFRKRLSAMSSNILGVFTQVFGVFSNMILAFQGIMLRMKDMMSKLMATVSVMLNVMKGIELTGKSAWNGPVGKTLRSVCFHPDTKVRLLSGECKSFKNISIDDVLEDGSHIYATLKLKGNKTYNNETGLNDFYKIYDTKYGEYIYVTGEHLVYDPTKCGYIKVKNYSLATHEPDIKTDFVYCCITDTHKIQIGNIRFWDWDDPVQKKQDNILE